jgi:hypothetical protein
MFQRLFNRDQRAGRDFSFHYAPCTRI